MKTLKNCPPEFMQPWFMPKDTYLAIRTLLPTIHLNKMRFYFEDWGCLFCHRKDVRYGTNGFCIHCSVRVRVRVLGSLKRRLKESRPVPLSGVQDALSYVEKRVLSAQHLLSGVKKSGIKPVAIRAVRGSRSNKKL